VHGGASGIGTTAIQMARAFGARVFTTVGSAAKAAACERLGAERAINYHGEDLVEVLRALTSGRGVDVVLDMVGGDYVARNLEILATEGRLVQIAFLHGARVELNLATIMQCRLTVPVQRCGREASRRKARRRCRGRSAGCLPCASSGAGGRLARAHRLRPWVPRLIDAELSAPRQRQPREQPPALLIARHREIDGSSLGTFSETCRVRVPESNGSARHS